MLESGFAVLVALVCIPTFTTGFFFFRFQKKMEKREAQYNKREDARKKNEVLIVSCIYASMALGEATARAMQVDNPKSNGDMVRALEYTKRVKQEHGGFLREQGIEHLY